VYGFITIPNELIFDLIEHPYFQRLRRIKQLGLTGLVYPGAIHTRFQHALGAMFLMCQAVDVLRQKGVEITAEEEQSTIIAILLHDIGHGPFSHALENCIVHNMNHEDLTELFFEALDQEFGGALGVAYQIYQDRYPKRFLHQLVSSQLDVDRLDYLSRDSFFTGVSEGIVGTERIIKMLNVAHDNLVVDIKGIYSVEKFVLSRRLMYWQVYLHKTVVGAEQLLIKVLRRAEFLTKSGAPIFLTPSFREFFEHNYTFEDFRRDPKILSLFANLDDDEVMTSIKIWQNHSDKVLSILAKQLINRSLFRVDFLDEPLSSAQLSDLRKSAMNRYQVSLEESEYFVFEGQISNSAYSNSESKINVLLRDGSLLDLAEASDQLNIDTLTKIVTKHFICYPKM
jgi:HD superfamily phosphohydrolase